MFDMQPKKPKYTSFFNRLPKTVKDILRLFLFGFILFIMVFFNIGNLANYVLWASLMVFQIFLLIHDVKEANKLEEDSAEEPKTVQSKPVYFSEIVEKHSQDREYNENLQDNFEREEYNED